MYTDKGKANAHFSSNKIGVLRHVPRAVHFAFVINTLCDLNSWPSEGMRAQLYSPLVSI